MAKLLAIDPISRFQVYATCDRDGKIQHPFLMPGYSRSNRNPRIVISYTSGICDKLLCKSLLDRADAPLRSGGEKHLVIGDISIKMR